LKSDIDFVHLLYTCSTENVAVSHAEWLCCWICFPKGRVGGE